MNRKHHEHRHHNDPVDEGRGGRSRRAQRGPRGPEGPPWGGGRRRMRRGDTRRALLAALLAGPGHGYELMGRLEARSGGMWRPSPGSVYPTLQLLEDEGLVHAEERDGTRVYDLTDAGREKAGEPFEEGHRPPWEHAEGDDRYRSLKETVGQLAMAARQVGAAGQAEQVDRAVEILARARRELYQLLAEV